MAVTLLKAGQHTCVGHLSSPAAAESPGELHFERPGMLVYCGDFESMDGHVEVTEEKIDRQIESHNARLAATLAQFPGDEPAFVRSMPPLQLDHSTDARRTIGRVLGTMSKGPYKLADGREVVAMFNSRIRVLGAENIEKTKDGRYGPVSIGADLEKGIFSELSIVAFPAAEGASLLARLKVPANQGDPMHEKLKKHLMEAKKMSSDQADEHLGRLKEHLKKHLGYDDEGAEKHLAGMEPDGAEKMGAAMSASEKLADDVKETEKKLSAARPNLIKMAKGLRKESTETRLAVKTTNISARLSRLQASAKITPAERKKLDLTQLAGKPDASIDEILGTYEAREPVIDPRVHGTTRAVNLSKLQKDASKARLMAETKTGLGMPLDENDKKALAEVPQPTAAVPAAPGEHEEHMKHLTALIGDHPQKDAIMAHVSKMLGAGHGLPVADVDHDEKQLSGLVEKTNRLHTQIEGIVKLIGDATGLTAEQLSE